MDKNLLSQCAFLEDYMSTGSDVGGGEGKNKIVMQFVEPSLVAARIRLYSAKRFQLRNGAGIILSIMTSMHNGSFIFTELSRLLYPYRTQALRTCTFVPPRIRSGLYLSLLSLSLSVSPLHEVLM